MASDDLTTVACLIYIKETEMAILVSDEDEVEFWLPKSQIVYDDEATRGDEIEIEMPEWLAIEKGLI